MESAFLNGVDFLRSVINGIIVVLKTREALVVLIIVKVIAFVNVIDYSNCYISSSRFIVVN